MKQLRRKSQLISNLPIDTHCADVEIADLLDEVNTVAYYKARAKQAREHRVRWIKSKRNGNDR